MLRWRGWLERLRHRLIGAAGGAPAAGTPPLRGARGDGGKGAAGAVGGGGPATVPRVFGAGGASGNIGAVGVGGANRAGGAGGAASDQPVALLAVTRDALQAAALRQVAEANGWTFDAAASASEAEGRLGRGPSAVVILDRDLPGDDWRHSLPRLAALPRTACVLLASTVADEYLWQEVNRRGGHDVLPKPLRPCEVARAVSFAWSWRGERGRG